jgi:hypothetical protein
VPVAIPCRTPAGFVNTFGVMYLSPISASARIKIIVSVQSAAAASSINRIGVCSMHGVVSCLYDEVS